jgi:hypothetical protein
MAPKAKVVDRSKKKPVHRSKRRSTDRRRRKEIASLVHALCTIEDDDHRNTLISHLNRDGREILYQCMHNCIYNKAISKSKRLELAEQLRPKKRTLAFLTSPRQDPVAKKKRLIRQTGNGILSLIPLILSTVLPLLSS